MYSQIFEETWTWINGQTINKYNLTHAKNLLETNITLGFCGTVALNKQHEFQIQSAPCISTKMRFICEYCNLFE